MEDNISKFLKEMEAEHLKEMEAENNKDSTLGGFEHPTPKSLLDEAQKGLLEGRSTGSCLGFGSHGMHCASKGPFTSSQLLELDRQILIHNLMDLNVRIPTSLLINTQKSIQSSGSFKSSNRFSSHGLHCPSKGPFTPSQLLELEWQILIYKHMVYNVCIPLGVLINIDAFEQPSGSSTSSTTGWRGGFSELVYANNKTDSEPWRCHRTDGKKWRCSKHVVGGEKYCAHHLKRGHKRAKTCVERTGENAVFRSTMANSSVQQLSRHVAEE